MASNPPFPVEDNTDEDFFDKLVNDDDDVDFKVTSSSASGGHTILTDGNESDEVKAFANLSINELDDNGGVNFDNIAGSDHHGVEDLNAKVETVECINEVGTVEEHGDPSMSSNSFEADLVQKLGNDNGGAEEVPYDADSGMSTIEGFSDATVVNKSSDGSGAPGVKEVEWSAFHADSTQVDGNGFGSYSDFFGEFGGENAGDAFSNMVQNGPEVVTENVLDGFTNVDGSNNFGKDNEEYNDGIAADQGSNLQDLSSTQYWENQYPGWRYDPNTGQWYQIDGYDAGATVQENAESNVSTNWGAVDGQSEVSYMQQTSQSVSEAVAEAGVTESVTNWSQASQASDATETTNWNQVSQVSSHSNASPSDWNQASHDNNGYPPHMVFDPQYPDWYYDTIAQEWRTLESYAQSTAQIQDHANHGQFSSADTFSQNTDLKGDNIHGQVNSYVSHSFSSQGVDQNWTGSVSNYNQQNSRSWLPETVSSNEATSLYNGKQVMENNYGQKVSLGPEQSNVHFGVKGSYYENQSQPQNNFSAQPQFPVSGNFGQQQLNDSKINQNDQKYFSNDYYSSQSSTNFPQQQLQNAQIPYTPASGRSSAGRPAHALVTFGFGGKLIVMKHSSTENLSFGSQNSAGGSISVLNLSEVANSNIDISNRGMGESNYFQALCRQSVPGPLTGGSVATKELNRWIDERTANLESANMDYKKAEVLRLLLSLLKIACQYYGKLRSPYGTDAALKETDTPESAVAKLFASAKRNGMQFGHYGDVTQCLQQLPSEGQLRVTAAEVQNLLVSGRKKEALQCAQEGQLWGPALVLAAQLGDQFYVETVKQMALRQLVAGSPLRTLCLLIAGQPADVFSADTTAINNSMAGIVNVSQQAAQFGANGMLDDWEENLAVITANRTKDDGLVLIHLGDCLWKERSDIIAAHICYLVAEASFEPYSDSARLCLVGADHWKFPRTYASPEAIQRTEIYEYSKTLGNSQFILLPFQPYKYVYAHMLAEVGRIPEALKYCQAVLKSLKTGRTVESETLRNLVSSLEERIKAHQQGGFSANLAPKEFIGKLLNLFDSTAHRVVGGLPPPIPTAGGTAHGHDSHYQSTGPRVSTSQSTMAMSSLVPSQSMEPINEWAADNRKSMHARSVSEPDFGRSPMQGQADPSKEASSTGVQDKASAAGGSSRFGRFSFGSQLLQKTVGLVLRPRQGRQAKLGDSNKFYYDEKLKRWVEEGAEPPQEEAALPPPPTTAVFQNGASDYNLKSALKSEAHHNNGSPEFKSPSTLDNNSGMPPLPPTMNQYSARGRMGVRSRYVDTFNKGGGNAPNTFQSPTAPSVKPAGSPNPKFFVPTPVPTVEQPVDTPVDHQQNSSSTYENSSTSLNDPSYQSPVNSPSVTMQRFASMHDMSNRGVSSGGSFSGNSRRTVSWGGSLNDSMSPPRRTELKPLGEVLGMHPSQFMSSEPSSVDSSVNRGGFGDDLHEVEL